MGPESFAAETGCDLPFLEPLGGVGSSGFNVPARELGHVLKCLHKLVYSVSLG